MGHPRGEEQRIYILFTLSNRVPRVDEGDNAPFLNRQVDVPETGIGALSELQGQVQVWQLVLEHFVLLDAPAALHDDVLKIDGDSNGSLGRELVRFEDECTLGPGEENID